MVSLTETWMLLVGYCSLDLGPYGQLVSQVLSMPIKTGINTLDVWRYSVNVVQVDCYYECSPGQYKMSVLSVDDMST